MGRAEAAALPAEVQQVQLSLGLCCWRLTDLFGFFFFLLALFIFKFYFNPPLKSARKKNSLLWLLARVDTFLSHDTDT